MFSTEQIHNTPKCMSIWKMEVKEHNGQNSFDLSYIYLKNVCEQQDIIECGENAKTSIHVRMMIKRMKIYGWQWIFVIKYLKRWNFRFIIKYVRIFVVTQVNKL